jgi:hypothetical protein
MALLVECFPSGKELESKPLAVCEHPLMGNRMDLSRLFLLIDLSMRIYSSDVF